MRALYLQGCPGMRVDYDEPALVVEAPDKTRQLFPVNRLSRVVVTGNVGWSMSALFACVDSGISVLFLKDDGAIRGRWLGVSRREGALQSLFSLLLFAERQDAYANWYKGMRRLAARSAARRLPFQDWQCADLEPLWLWVEQSLSPRWREICLWLSGVIESAVTEYLFSYGVSVETEAEMACCLRLVHDLSVLLLADFYPLLFKWSQVAAEPPSTIVLLQHFESRSERLEHLLRGALIKLHRVLKELD